VFRNPSNAPGDDDVVVGSAPTRVTTPPKAIGEIHMATGSVTVRRAGGVAARVDVGELVYQGDAIETGADGAVGIIFTDGTAFNLSSDARAVLNEFAYDPNATSNSALLSLAQGTFAFIAGKVAKAGSLRIDTPVARIRGGAQDGGIGILTLAALTFSATSKTEAASRHDAFLDDGTIAQYGTFEIVTKEAVPRVIIVDDPSETIVLRRAGSAITVDRVTHTATRTAELQTAYREAFDTQSQGQQGSGPPGSSGNPLSNQAPLDPQLAPQPINNVLPGGIISPDIPILNSTPIFVPLIAPPPPQTAPTITLAAIAITNPGTGISILNASEANAGFSITGTTSGVENGRTVTIAIVDGSNQAVHRWTTAVTNGNWSVNVGPGAAKSIADGSYMVTADVSDAAGTPASQAWRTIMVDETVPSAPVITFADQSASAAAPLIQGPPLAHHAALAAVPLTHGAAPLTLTITAEAGSTVNVYRDGVLLGTATESTPGQRLQLHRDRNRPCRQHQLGIGGVPRHHRHDGSGAEHAGIDGRVRQRQLEHGQHHQCHHAGGDRQRRRGGRHGHAV
jgi:FecR protein